MSPAISRVAANMPEVLRRLQLGDTNKQIADWLGISTRMFRKAKHELKIPQQRMIRPVDMSWDDIRDIGQLCDTMTLSQLAARYHCSEVKIARAIKLATAHGYLKRVHGSMPRVPLARVYNRVQEITEPTVVTLRNRPAYVLVPLDMWDAERAQAVNWVEKEHATATADPKPPTKKPEPQVTQPVRPVTIYTVPAQQAKVQALHGQWR